MTMTSAEFRDICLTAIGKATVSRGLLKGQLLARCPRSDSDGAAAWQAMTIRDNPWILGDDRLMRTVLNFSERQQAIYHAIDKAIILADASEDRPTWFQGYLQQGEG